MIKSFRDKRTEEIFVGRKVARLDKKLADKARRRLEQLNAAERLEDMYFPPSNHFHALEGFHPTRYSVRVDLQWRITFQWDGGNAFEVCFEDPH
jgi:toxin HigB-1